MYSVFNAATRMYDYFETPDPAPTHAGAPPRTSVSSALGATPEEASWRLPASARRVGAGPTPRGRVASTAGGGALGGVAETVKRTPLLGAAIGAVAYLLWRIR